ncbi:MAG: substrate-binding and VWA domain-containing protein, partial [Acidimicrobiia bacterium]|nr:substrate-binding and VWA domain-containing protein [Acidimicrobiia bacterium]
KGVSVKRIGIVVVWCLLATGCVGGSDTTTPGDDVSLAVPEGCREVPAAVSSEKVTLLTDLAEAYNATEPSFDGQCVAITIYRVASGRAAKLLAEGWPTDGSASPAPVLWSPASAAWGALVNYRLELAGQAPIANDYQRIMLTPLVLAMPKPMAEALGWPEADIGWSDILELAQDPEGWGAFGHPEWGPFRLGKTNPNFSTSGLSATIAIYYAATGKRTALTLDDVGSASVGAFVRGVESATVHYGDTTLTFLENMLKEDLAGRPLSYASAAAVEEVSIIAYNRGDPADTGADDLTPPNVPLVAVYPKEGTVFSDNPAFVLDAPWVDDISRQAAEAFRSFVIDDPEIQARVLEFGFRPGNPAVAVGDPISSANGLNPSQPETELLVPEPEVLAALVDGWETYRKTARVVMVIDVSGSMGDLAGEGFSKLDLVKQAVAASLDQFKSEDEVGLWIFSTGLDGDRDYLELVPPAPLSQTEIPIRRAVESLIADGGTGLYDSTRAAVQAVREGFDQTKINAVILLTDGKCDDNPPGCELDPLLDYLASSERDVVRVFPVAYGADANLAELQAIADATAARLYKATDPLTIEEVFEQVVSNF